MTWTIPALGRVTSAYGPRKLPGAISDFHAGTDIGAKRGPVYAAQDGVVRAIWQTAKGAWVVDLRHPDESGQQIRTRYVHMYLSEITVRVGQHVRAGQPIGRSGASGTGAAHLHFEVMVNDELINPEPFMAQRAAALGEGPIAAPIPSPTQNGGAPALLPITSTEEDDEMLVIAKLKNSPHVYVGNGITRTRVANPAALADLVYRIRTGVFKGDPNLHVVDRIDWLGKEV